MLFVKLSLTLGDVAVTVNETAEKTIPFAAGVFSNPDGKHAHMKNHDLWAPKAWRHQVIKQPGARSEPGNLRFGIPKAWKPLGKGSNPAREARRQIWIFESQNLQKP